jgi:membrane peptidoglycan carboxypeptidase
MYFGQGDFGIDAAARRYFGKTPQDLDAGEIAELLAVSPNAAIGNHPEKARASRDGLLHKLHEYGVIDEPTMLAAIERDVRRFK